jgi:hypothetical protein
VKGKDGSPVREDQVTPLVPPPMLPEEMAAVFQRMKEMGPPG